LNDFLAFFSILSRKIQKKAFFLIFLSARPLTIINMHVYSILNIIRRQEHKNGKNKMKLKVKYYKRKKNGKVYKQAWIGYSYRRENSVPDFKREISLAGLDEKIIQGIDIVLRNNGDMSNLQSVSFEKSVNIGSVWSAYCTAENLGIIDELNHLEEQYRAP